MRNAKQLGGRRGCTTSMAWLRFLEVLCAFEATLILYLDLVSTLDTVMNELLLKGITLVRRADKQKLTPPFQDKFFVLTQVNYTPQRSVDGLCASRE